MRSIYLDSNVLIAIYASGKSETAKQMVQKSFDVFAKAGAMWLLHIRVGRDGNGQHSDIVKENARGRRE